MGLFTNAGEVAAVANPIVGGVLTVVGKVLDNLFPDPAQRAAAALELEKLQDGKEARELAALLQEQMGQVDIDKIEAASDDPFKSRWRPFIGWVCGTAFGWEFVARPALTFALAVAGHPLTLPAADMSQMMPVLLGMLGLGTMRMAEKIKGAA